MNPKFGMSCKNKTSNSNDNTLWSLTNDPTAPKSNPASLLFSLFFFLLGLKIFFIDDRTDINI